MTREQAQYEAELAKPVRRLSYAELGSLLVGALGCVGSAGVALFYEEPRGGWED